MPVDPMRCSDAIRRNYLTYLETTFPLRDAELRQQFVGLLREPGRFVKGPILEVTPPFESATRLEDLVGEGVLSPSWRCIFGNALPADRPLYRHQEEAIRKAISLRRNLVIASGTGSGKTEAFMVPIIEELLRERDKGTLSPGVRALLLYPMNALANDQLVRLRQLLANCPEITFGRYTGETEWRTPAARDLYWKMFQREPLPNELLSREQMWESPPHILLTNYAMLEYLLLRPFDSVFFDGEHARHWRFLVLDEVHSYSGARGIEMAMLLRRLKDRVAQGREGLLQCFGTSATLGRGQEDFPLVAAFAQKLFGETFEWRPDDPARQDVIGASRTSLSEVAAACQESYAPDPRLYEVWARFIEGEGNQPPIAPLVNLGMEYGVPEHLLRSAQEGACGNLARFLFEILRGDRRLHALYAELERGPRALVEAAGVVFPGTEDASSKLVALVDLACKARRSTEEAPLLPARYHLFVRAMEGAFLRMGPTPALFLERREEDEVDGRKWPVFQIGTCRNCGALYLLGRIDRSGSGRFFRQISGDSGEDWGRGFFLVVDRENREIVVDEDEDINFAASGLPERGQRYRLCAACGAIAADDFVGPVCDCGLENHVLLFEAAADGGKVCYCPACGKRNPHGMVWPFMVATDAAAGVLATALYQHIVPGTQGPAGVRNPDSRPRPIVSAGWEREDDATRHPVDRAPRLLAFSDSRQDAAFFGPYLSRTYNSILRRTLIRRVIDDYRETIVAKRWRLGDLVGPLRQLALENGVLTMALSPQQQENEVWKWVMQEFLGIDRHTGLEGLGFLSFSPVFPDRWYVPGPLVEPPWSLSTDEVWLLLRLLLDSFRSRGAVTFPNHVSPEDETFSPRNREYFFRHRQPSRTARILCWCPSSPVGNARVDYLQRLLQALGVSGREGHELATQVLSNIWTRHLAPDNSASVWHRHFVSRGIRGEGVAFQMRHDMWELDVDPSQDSDRWFICDKCENLTRLNIKGVCPTYRCTGRLHHLDAERAKRLAQNHYRQLYTVLKPIPMRAEEHTAQLRSEEAAKLQTEFTCGDVNVLSCSTTFELGVDLGTLEAVFLRNVPPGPANYVQRAGRAGRRTGSAAFVVTYAQRRSHDLDHYREPEKLVAGSIRPPQFVLENEKIVRRHVYATALAHFWRQSDENRKTYGRGHVDDFFRLADGPGLFRGFLNGCPQALLTSLMRVVPNESMREALAILNWGWVEGLVGEQGVLTRAAEEFYHDLQELDQAIVVRQREGRPSDFLLRAKRTICERDLLGYLSSRSVIPKYGFPVDVVELQLAHHGEAAARLQLERDLRIALSEYAPDSQVVAGGLVWTSRYLKRLPRKEWPRYRYAICNYCQRYQRVLYDSGEELERCAACGRQLTGRRRGDFVVPEFGFISATDHPSSPGVERPPRTHSTRVYFAGDSVQKDRLSLRLGAVTVEVVAATHGRLAVINDGHGRGFRVCFECGYACLSDNRRHTEHATAYGRPCNGRLQHGVHLGHEFETDVTTVIFQGHRDDHPGFWYSLLYGILEGASEALGIERQDIDGCLYPIAGDPSQPALVFFDDVPGGAGHVGRLCNEVELLKVLRTTLERLGKCECGNSCYGCLRDYSNQFCHDLLNRTVVVRFLQGVLGEGDHGS